MYAARHQLSGDASNAATQLVVVAAGLCDGRIIDVLAGDGRPQVQGVAAKATLETVADIVGGIGREALAACWLRGSVQAAAVRKEAARPLRASGAMPAALAALMKQCSIRG